ncbi:Cytochrome b561 [Gemmobacter megaterium]|uniref:Cytochrome b561 n=1 Tax=Gemmobacter megaterium TaxID=1086013 RepID=A0A1N7NUG3_9RHOB|nr:cytochrome b/b6 domain-containing protein [Gemmobacter megaterium]GGE16536.1 cytochrome b561 [Gemmobacter megaterium]SIT02003.1 Cytochrome b561 [Gemmobacter megaterium]
MAAQNTPQSYGSVARGLHWLTAGLILLSWPLGQWATGLPHDTGAALAFKAQVFSVHKTLGIAAFFVGLARMVWALTQVHPAPVRPDRGVEVWLAALVHWALYLALVLVPLTGWIHHAATEGFAPILWPLGQGLPLVPKSEALAAVSGAAHAVFTKVLLGVVLLHVGGALKHALLDRDGTLRRMVSGHSAGKGSPSAPRGTAVAAMLVWVAAGGVALTLAGPASAPPPAAPGPVTAQAAGDWRVQEGSLGIAVRQMGAVVEGSFATWSAAIRFDPDRTEGNHVDVLVDVASLRLGSVSAQATGPEFLNAEAHPQARYVAQIRRDGDGWLADGTLALGDAEVPVLLPFTLEIDGPRATMRGTVRLDRRDFGIGAAYPDEKTVGFAVELSVALVAERI